MPCSTIQPHMWQHLKQKKVSCSLHQTDRSLIPNLLFAALNRVDKKRTRDEVCYEFFAVPHTFLVWLIPGCAPMLCWSISRVLRQTATLFEYNIRNIQPNGLGAKRLGAKPTCQLISTAKPALAMKLRRTSRVLGGR